MSRKKKSEASNVFAIVGLIVNVLIPPAGLGTLVAGKLSSGLLQVGMTLLGYSFVIIGFLLTVFLVGIPILIFGIILVLVAWVWSIISVIKQLV